MDSCHFLNFFFGQKKATTEISKCINSLTNLKGSKKFKVRDTSNASYKIKEIDDDAENKPSSSNHLSPIKQLKSRFFGGHQSDQPTSEQSQTLSTKQILVPKDKRDTPKDNFSPESDELKKSECASNSENDANTDDNISTISVVDGASQVKGIHSTVTISSTSQTNAKSSVVYVNPPVSSIVVICPQESASETDKESDSEKSTNSRAADTESHENSSKQSPLKPPFKTGRKRLQQHIIYDDSPDKNHEKPIATAIVCDIISENRKLYKERKFSLQEAGFQSTILSHGEEEQIQRDKSKSNKFIDKFLLEGKNSNGIKVKSICESLRRSSEGNNNRDDFASLQDASLQSKPHNLISKAKPTTIVKPLPPKTPPKSSKARYINYQLNLNSVTKIQDLLRDEKFIRRFFEYFDPIDYCTLAQVCKIWRKTLYSNHKYWTGLINVIDCNQLRRECLIERNTQNTKQESEVTKVTTLQSIDENNNESDWYAKRNIHSQSPNDWPSPPSPIPVSHQTVCIPLNSERTVQGNSFAVSDEFKKQVSSECKDFNVANEQAYLPPSKSCSIQSQISTSLVSSSSGLSLLSPTSDSSKFESVKGKLYNSIDKRGFDAICLFGANDEDIIDLVNRLPQRVLTRLRVARLNNSSISNKGLESFMTAMSSINELELSGCNELTNNINLTCMKNLTKLIITDCINIADGFAPKLSHVFGQLTEFTLQAYHITDAFFDYLQTNVNGEKLAVLELPNCKEISNQSLRTITRFFPNLRVLSLSGSSKISDEGIEIIAEQSHYLTKLDISWCTRVTDAALECMACDLSESLKDLVLDRCIHITDIGLGHIATMTHLESLEIRWCPQVSDQGLETIVTMRSLRNLSIAGCHQITMRSLLCLVRSQLIELELTNCPSVSSDLVSYLRKGLPSCKIIF